MNNNILTETQKSTIHNCLLDLLESSSLNNPSFLPKALDCLSSSQGFGIEASGIYISSDNDPDNIPDYLHEGIAFEFMENHVALPFKEAIVCVVDWCESRNLSAVMGIGAKLQNLQSKYK